MHRLSEAVRLPAGRRIAVRFYPRDGSLFVDDDYLIRGVPGRLLLHFLEDYARTGKREFLNREIRRDRRLQLPDFKDNLETRLILLRLGDWRKRRARLCSSAPTAAGCGSPLLTVPRLSLWKTDRGGFPRPENHMKLLYQCRLRIGQNMKGSKMRPLEFIRIRRKPLPNEGPALGRPTFLRRDRWNGDQQRTRGHQLVGH